MATSTSHNLIPVITDNKQYYINMSSILMFWRYELQEVQSKYMTPHLGKVICSQWRYF